MEEGGAVSAIDVGLDYMIYRENMPRGGDMERPYRINISTYHTPLAPEKNHKKNSNIFMQII